MSLLPSKICPLCDIPDFTALRSPCFDPGISWKKNKDKPPNPCTTRDSGFVLIIPYGHTFATHALAGGVGAKTLSGILGHTKASFTLDTYAHVTGDMHRYAAKTVGDFILDIL